jgi:hypothetical protein
MARSVLGCECPSCLQKAAEHAKRQAAKDEVARSFGGVSPCRPPSASEPPVQKGTLCICRVCGLEYVDAPGLRTHVCYACRLPAVRKPELEPFRWAPWESPDIHRNAMGDLPSIKEPPCSRCCYWHPSVKLKQAPGFLSYDGVVCCHSPEMKADFSCCVVREPEPNKES